MVATKYSYNISLDFPNSKVSSDRLTYEIQESPISKFLEYITTEGDNCNIWFEEPLSSQEETTLDELVAVHSGLLTP